MKKLLIILTITTFIFSCDSDESSTTNTSTDNFNLKINNEIVYDGDTFTFSETGSSTDMEFYFENLTTNSINTFVKIESITNGTGNELTLCYRVCYFGGFSVGQILPDTAEVIASGSTSALTGNHFAFRDDASIVYPDNENITYVLKFYEVDDRGEQIGTPIRINYVYSPL